ncbi:DNA-binding protein [Shewanella fidelis]|uniref:DNA-binding protein n=1 Tax=Shewanella fidelis TaxID=173509 RepID=A0AAW8NND0_9GAMM|nr:DNA-binding protein [Shewanella fidelis]MDR8523443.1 DNA-binding protein [Shewanella fidelis]MDW4813323.1 DNA-binding protein [Shewanella fidelis]MDW4817305.1 DNA-binding protein [Shewanella fidelis]MDW4821338.1 DNA-binding protein [Shewanella fidelis]MDW4824584.1 DNA-binding protein [Shewanella fidelis]
MIKQWYTAKELSGLPGLPKSDRNIRLNANKHGWTSRSKARGKGFEYHFDSLPLETKAYLRAKTVEKSTDVSVIAAKSVITQSAAKQSQSRQQRISNKSQGLKAFMCLTEVKQEKAKAREKIVTAYEQFIAPYIDAGNKSDGINAFVIGFNSEKLLADKAVRTHVKQVAERTLYRWSKAYSQDGVMGLVDQYKGNAKSKIDEQPRLGEFLMALVTKKPHLLKQAAKVRDMAMVRSDEYGWQLPSISSFKRWLNQYADKHELEHAFTTNPTLYTDKYRPLFARMYPHIDGPNQVWEFDSTPTDVELNVNGRLKRHSIVAVIDAYTRRVQLIVAPTSNSEAICLLLRKTLLEWGLPEEGAIMRTDNGSDYVSQRTTTIFNLLDLKLSKANAFSGWEKPFIERFFGTMSRVLMEKMPGYIGHSVSDRQQIEAMYNFAKRIGEGKKQAEAERLSLALTPEQLQQALNDYLEFDYNHVPHDKTDKTPFELYAGAGYQKRVIGNDHILDTLLNFIGTAKVVRGSVKADGVQYTAPELMEASWQRQTVRVFVDPCDIGRATLYPIDQWDTYVDAVNMDLVNRGIAPSEFRERRKQTQKELAAFRKSAKRLQQEFGIDSLYADELAQKKLQRASLSYIESTTGHGNNAIAGLNTATSNKQHQLNENELAAIERQREAIAKRKASMAEQESRIVRSDHEKAVLLTQDSLTRKLSQAEQDWLKKYRLNNLLQRNRLDKILNQQKVKKAEQLHRQVK